MKQSTKAPKTIIAASGSNWQITYVRGDGYSATLAGRYLGSRDRLSDALELVNGQWLADAALGARLTAKAA